MHDASIDRRDWIGESHESIMARLDGARTVQGQVRAALVTLAVISGMMLIVSYNAYLSYDSDWVRQAVHEEQDGRAKSGDDGGGRSLSAELKSEELKTWVAAQAVGIALLGVHVSVDDAPTIGTFALAVVSIWLLLLMRRENHTIGFLMRATDSQAVTSDAGISDEGAHRSLRWLIFHSISASNMFLTLDASLARVDDLKGESNPFVTNPTYTWRERGRRLAFGFGRGFFFLFPVAASSIVWGLDVWSYFRPDPFDDMSVSGWAEPFLYKSSATYALFAIPLLYCCIRSNAYSIATNRVVRQYGARLYQAAVRRETTFAMR